MVLHLKANVPERSVRANVSTPSAAAGGAAPLVYTQ